MRSALVPVLPLGLVLLTAACVDPMPPLQPLPPLSAGAAAAGPTAGGVASQPEVRSVVVPAPALALPAERTRRPEHVPPPDPPLPGTAGDWPPSLRQLQGLERSPYLPQRPPIGLSDCPAPAAHCR